MALRLYIDGTEVASDPTTVVTTPGDASMISNYGNGSPSLGWGPRRFPGHGAHLAWYGHALDATRVAAHHTAMSVSPAAYRAAVLADMPLSYWPMDDTSGDPQDIVGGNHLTLQTGRTNTPVVDAFTGGAYDLFAGGWGTTRRVPHGPYTIEAWVKRTANLTDPTDVAPIGDWGGTVGYHGAMLFTENVAANGTPYRPGVLHQTVQLRATTTLTTGVWFHWVATFDTGTRGFHHIGLVRGARG